MYFLDGVEGEIWSFWVVEKWAHGFRGILGHWIAKKMRYIAFSQSSSVYLVTQLAKLFVCNGARFLRTDESENSIVGQVKY